MACAFLACAIICRVRDCTEWRFLVGGAPGPGSKSGPRCVSGDHSFEMRWQRGVDVDREDRGHRKSMLRQAHHGSKHMRRTLPTIAAAAKGSRRQRSRDYQAWPGSPCACRKLNPVGMWQRIGRRCADVGRHQADLGIGDRSVPVVRLWCCSRSSSSADVGQPDRICGPLINWCWDGSAGCFRTRGAGWLWYDRRPFCDGIKPVSDRTGGDGSSPPDLAPLGCGALSPPGSQHSQMPLSPQSICGWVQASKPRSHVRSDGAGFAMSPCHSTTATMRWRF